MFLIEIYIILNPLMLGVIVSLSSVEHPQPEVITLLDDLFSLWYSLALVSFLCSLSLNVVGAIVVSACHDLNLKAFYYAGLNNFLSMSDLIFRLGFFPTLWMAVVVYMRQRVDPHRLPAGLAALNSPWFGLVWTAFLVFHIFFDLSH